MKHALSLTLWVLLTTGCPNSEPAPTAGKTGPASQPAPAAKEAEPQATALTPRLEVGKDSPLQVKAVVTQTRGTRGLKVIFDMKMTLKVQELKGTNPARVEYGGITGSQTLFRITDGEESDAGATPTKAGAIQAGVDGTLSLVDPKDIAMSDDILLAFPPGPLYGFVPPKGGTAKPGETWDSGSLVPIGPKTLKKGQLKFSEIKGQFELRKGGDQAEIVWTGAAAAQLRGQKGRATWERTTRLDPKRGRVLSSEGTLKITFKDSTVTHQVSIRATD